MSTVEPPVIEHNPGYPAMIAARVEVVKFAYGFRPGQITSDERNYIIEAMWKDVLEPFSPRITNQGNGRK